MEPLLPIVVAGGCLLRRRARGARTPPRRASGPGTGPLPQPGWRTSGRRTRSAGRFSKGAPGGLRVRLERYRRGRYESGTRVVIQGLARLSVRRETTATAIEKRFLGETEIELGAPTFDQRCFVTGSPALRARSSMRRPADASPRCSRASRGGPEPLARRPRGTVGGNAAPGMPRRLGRIERTRARRAARRTRPGAAAHPAADLPCALPGTCAASPSRRAPRRAVDARGASIRTTRPPGRLCVLCREMRARRSACARRWRSGRKAGRRCSRSSPARRQRIAARPAR